MLRKRSRQCALGRRHPLFIERLEARHVLSVSSLGFADSFSTSPSTPNDMAAMMAQPLSAPVNTSTVAPLANTTQLRYRLEALDMSDQPITVLTVGQEFQLAAFVQDVRTPTPAPAGVFAGYLNVSYDPALASISPSATFTNGSFFSIQQSGSVAIAGQIAGAGAAATSFKAPGNAEQLLWTVPVQAAAVGSLIFTSSFDAIAGHDNLLYGLDDPIPQGNVEFDTLTLQVFGDTVPVVSISNVSETEGSNAGTDTPFVFSVNLYNPTNQTVTVDYATGGGTATPSADYTPTSGRLTFAAGVTQQFITVLIKGDLLVEANETFSVTLSAPSTGTQLASSVSTGTILDDDATPTLAISNAVVTEGNGGTTSMVFTVSLSAPSGRQVTAQFATADGTATAAADDYQATSGTLTLAPGETSKLVTVAINGDSVMEGNETFTLGVSNLVNATLSPATDQGIGAIQNDDFPRSKAAVVSGLGTVRLNPFSQGDYEIISDDFGRLEPADSLPPELRIDGLRISFVGDVVSWYSIPEFGVPVNLRSIELIGSQAITTDPGVQQMPSVAVDPLDANHVVVAYMDYSLLTTGYAGIAVAVSRDGGASWQRTSIPLPDGFQQGAANPIARFDGEGRLFVSFMAATFLGELPPITNPGGGPLRALGFQSNNGIFVSRSDDGGDRWKTPSEVTSHRYDGAHSVPFEIIPDLAIDTFRILPNGLPNPNYGSLYATWSRYYPAGQYPGESNSGGGGNIMIAVSRDGGNSWQTQLESHPEESSEPITVIYNKGMFTGQQMPEGLGFENWAHVTVGPEGDVYVSQFLGSQFVVHHSTDGGRSFVHPDPTTASLFPFGVNNDVSPGPLTANQFRLQVVRAIVADPARPGYVYAVDAKQVSDAQGSTQDEGEVIFARSTDYGATWRTTFRLPVGSANVINDDNDGRTSAGSAGEVASSQALPRLQIDRAGNIGIIWYDARRDPADHLLDVFGAVSRDGGSTFSPNYRVSDQSFDADQGAFQDAAGKTDYYLGDFLGLALADQVAYAAWTGTRNGNQDIYFARYGTSPPPLPLNDRYEPNDSRSNATQLGRVVARDVPKLSIALDDSDWFRIRTAATGNLTVTTTSEDTGDFVRLELFDQDGTTRLATGTAVRDARGQMVGQSIVYDSPSDRTYLVHILPGPAVMAGMQARYSLNVSSLTADLGSQVYGIQQGNLAPGAEAYFALRIPASGSLAVTLMPGAGAQGTFRLEVLDASTFSVLASGNGNGAAIDAGASVTKDRVVYLHVVGDANTQGNFTLEYTNLDEFATPDSRTVFVPTASGPSASILADLNNDGALDIIVSHVGQDMISVLVNNGDGTFRAPRNFAVGAFQQGGPFTLQGLQNFHRDLAVADFNRDGFLDVVVVNTSSSDVSLLLGNGDGTFQPHRRFDATAAPFALAVGLLNGDDFPDLVVVDSTPGTAQAAVLLGRGNGTFQLPLFFSLPNHEPNRTNAIRIADVNGDGKNDLIERDFQAGTIVLLGNGDGTFRLESRAIQPVNGPGVAVADLDGDGNVDVVTTANNTGRVLYTLGNGDGTFQADSGAASTGQFPVAVAVADFASVAADGSIVIGVGDGRPDLIVSNNGRSLPTFSGPAEVVLLAGMVDKDGHFDGFSDPVRLAAARGPLDVNVGDVNGDGVLDAIVVDRDGILVIYGRQHAIKPNDTLQTARDLGPTIHLMLPTLTITPSHQDAWYRLQVPVEVVPGSGDQVLDFSGGFVSQSGAGLMMEVVDASGQVRGSGERFRVVARQGETLLVHVVGRRDGSGAASAGAYTLVIDTLPQVVNVEAQTLLPGQLRATGGPTTSLVLVFQGDRLQASSAENPANYHVIWLGPDGIRGTADDREIPVGLGLPANSQSVVYNAGSNVNVSSGRTHPVATRQTVTLLFGEPLPPGAYEILVSDEVLAAAFSVDELSLLSPLAGSGHTVVMREGGTVREGSSFVATELVPTVGALGDLSVFELGTRFFTQFHDDLGALLDAQLTAFGDENSITRDLLQHIVDRFSPALGQFGERLISLAIIFLDPLSFGLDDPDGRTFSYNLKDGSVVNGLRRTFVEVGGNVEVVVIPNPMGAYSLNVADVPDRARGGLVYLDAQGALTRLFTDSLRTGASQFTLFFDPPAALGGIANGLIARGNGPLQISAGGPSSESAAASSGGPARADRAATASPLGLMRSTGRSTGMPRNAPVDPLDALGELLTQVWDGLLRGLMQGLRGNSANADSESSAAPAPWWKAFGKFLDGTRTSNGSASSSTQSRRVNEPRQVPPTSRIDQETLRRRTTARVEAALLDAVSRQSLPFHAGHTSSTSRPAAPADPTTRTVAPAPVRPARSTHSSDAPGANSSSAGTSHRTGSASGGTSG
jgi:hypothetical protein